MTGTKSWRYLPLGKVGGGVCNKVDNNLNYNLYYFIS